MFSPSASLLSTHPGHVTLREIGLLDIYSGRKKYKPMGEFCGGSLTRTYIGLGPMRREPRSVDRSVVPAARAVVRDHGRSRRPVHGRR